MLEDFFNQSLDLLCIARFDGRFTRLNPAWTTQLGWTPEVLESRPFLDLVHPDDRNLTRAQVARLAGGADAVFFGNRFRHQNGAYHCLEWNARRVPGGELICASVRDVTRQKELEREIVEIADREKERLGRDLHDGLCQTLAGIAALCATLARRLSANSQADASAAASEITKLLNEAIGEAHDLARGLGPVGLEAAGLAEALKDLTLSIHRAFRIACTLESDVHFPRLQPEVEAHLFRIAQEAVNNAVAHARADRIEVCLSRLKGKGRLSVRDNGTGLREETPHGKGIGMRTMAHRALLVGGSLDVRGQALGGTSVTCVFPLSEAGGNRENLGHARNDH